MIYYPIILIIFIPQMKQCYHARINYAINQFISIFMCVVGQINCFQSLHCRQISSPYSHLLGTRSPLNGSRTSKDGLLRTIHLQQVHTGSLYTCSNEQGLVNNNSLVLLKLRGTHPGGECLPTRPHAGY